MTKFNTLGFSNDQTYLDRTANSYQKKMFNSLVELERVSNRSHNDSYKKTTEIINIAVNNNDLGLESMRSVVDYFLPKLRGGVLKDGLERIHNAIHAEIQKRESSTEKERLMEELKKPVPTPESKSRVAKAPKKKETEDFTEIGEDFPVFDDSNFPDTTTDIFSKMLETS